MWQLKDELSEKRAVYSVCLDEVRELLYSYIYSAFPLGCEGGIWDLIVFVSDHCLSLFTFYISELFQLKICLCQ